MTPIPPDFLFRIAYPCRLVPSIPDESGERLLNLPESCRLENFAAMTGRKPFGDVRIAWNDAGLGFQVEVRGKERLPEGNARQPQSSDGATLWIDTRDTRNIHRATRYCHQFFFLPTGGGDAADEPAAGQIKIHRALQDAPEAGPDALLFQSRRTRGGYILEAFLPAGALYGFDPETNPRLGVFYRIRDRELGEQTLGVGVGFPFGEDPSLWATLELKR